MNGMGSDREYSVKRPDNPSQGPVFYWMSRDQRVSDNWALVIAQKKALEMKRPLAVIFCLVDSFLGATFRQYGFMLRGLEKVEKGLAEKNIPFFCLHGEPAKEIPAFLSSVKAGWLFMDFDPLRLKRQWKAGVAKAVKIPITEVDAHNIVPCRVVSQKQEWAAYTLRPKIHKLLDEYLVPPPRLKMHPWPWSGKTAAANWARIRNGVRVDRSVGEVKWIEPGEDTAKKVLKTFIKSRLPSYGERKKDPGSNVQSELSPYLHFGQLSPARVAFEVRAISQSGEAVDGFLEELLVRRELADNFCFYNPYYDSIKGFPDWSRKTLDAHRSDPRPYVYSFETFEGAATHDPLWNAAQNEMVQRGKMHGYLRMYWAKKILEWTPSPEEALETAIRLNDRYELDGRDPSGYTGIAWSIGGVHDRAWGERPVFGKVRYMSEKGVRGKFDVNGYIEKWGKG